MRLYDLQKQYPNLSKSSILPSGNEVWVADMFGIEDLGHSQALEIIVFVRAIICPHTHLVLTLSVDDQSSYYDY